MGKKVRRKGQQAEEEEDKTERIALLGRRTSEDIVKWNQMTALTFQTGEDIRYPQCPFGGHCRVIIYDQVLSINAKAEEARFLTFKARLALAKGHGSREVKTGCGW